MQDVMSDSVGVRHVYPELLRAVPAVAAPRQEQPKKPTVPISTSSTAAKCQPMFRTSRLGKYKRRLLFPTHKDCRRMSPHIRHARKVPRVASANRPGQPDNFPNN